MKWHSKFFIQEKYIGYIASKMSAIFFRPHLLTCHWNMCYYVTDLDLHYSIIPMPKNYADCWNSSSTKKRIFRTYSYPTRIILCIRAANWRRRYIVTLSLICWEHSQNDPCPTWFMPWSFLWLQSVDVELVGGNTIDLPNCIHVDTFGGLACERKKHWWLIDPQHAEFYTENIKIYAAPS